MTTGPPQPSPSSPTGVGRSERGPSAEYVLSPHQLAQVRAILEREQQTTAVPWPARLLRGAVYLFGLAFVAVWLLAVFDPPESVINIVVMVGAVAFLGIVVLFFLNLPYVRKLARQYRVVKSLGLLDALRSPWAAERRRARMSNVLDLAIRVVAVLPIVVFCAGGLVLAAFLGNGASIVLLGIGVVSVALIGVMAIFLDYRTRTKKSRLALVTRLASSLPELKKPGSEATPRSVNLPAPAYEKLAEIERAQIAYQQMQSMLAVDEAAAYAVQKSREALEAQARFDAATRLRVQEQIDALAEEPRPAGATEDATGGLRRLPVPGTSVTVVYSVDDEARRVRVSSFTTPAGAEGAGFAGSG